jgi:hypothetical protein
MRIRSVTGSRGPRTSELTAICDGQLATTATEITKGVFDTTGNQEERRWREYIKRVGEQTDPVGLLTI